jgi:hypothetical protein
MLVLLASLQAPRRVWTIHPVHLASALARQLDCDTVVRPLLADWRKVAVMRDGFDAQALDAAAERVCATTADWALLRRTMTERDPLGRWRMPRVLREAALRGARQDHAAAREDHDVAVNYYASRLDDGERGSLRARVEQVHHLGLSVDVDALLHIPLVFKEQLHHIGWWLSAQLNDYESAAEVFRVAVAREATDAYAHHYLAFNLDLLGREPDTVESGYRTALTRDPGSVWWHSRWIRFLVTRERISEAHQAWHDARNQLLPPDAARGSAELYQELHRDVARWLLYALEFDFAREVLNDVPREIAARFPEFAALAERVDQLDAIDPEADYVPIWTAHSDWPARGPFLLRRELGQLARLTRWWAGKVDLVDDNNALLSVAAIEVAETDVEPEPLEVRVPVHQLETDSSQPGEVQPGRFLEIGFYSLPDGQEFTLAGIHPERDPRDSLLPLLHPAGTRYLRDAPLYSAPAG